MEVCVEVMTLQDNKSECEELTDRHSYNHRDCETENLRCEERSMSEMAYEVPVA